LGTQTGGPIADTIDGVIRLVDFFDDLIVVTSNLGKASEETGEALQTEGNALDALARQAALINPLLGQIVNSFNNIGDVVPTTEETISALGSGFGFLAGEVAQLVPIINLFNAALEIFGEKGKFAEDVFDKLGETAEGIRSPLLSPKEALDELSQALTDFDIETQDVADDLKELGSVLTVAQVTAARKAVDEQQKLEDFLFRSNRTSLEDFKDILDQRLVALRANTNASLLEIAKVEVQRARIFQQLLEADLEEDPQARIRNFEVTTALIERLQEGTVQSQEISDARRRESDNELNASMRQNAIETSAITLDAISGVLRQIEGQTRGVINQILRLIDAVVRAAAAFQTFRASTLTGLGSFLPVIGPILGVIGTLLSFGKLSAGGSSEPGPIPTNPDIGSTGSGLIGGPQGNLISSLVSQPQPGTNNAQTSQNNRELIEAIQNIRIVIRSELDSIQFFRDTLPDFQRTQGDITF